MAKKDTKSRKQKFPDPPEVTYELTPPIEQDKPPVRTHTLGEDVSSELVEVSYTNHRGIKSTRHILPINVWFGSTAWHPHPQHLLKVFDVDRCDVRDYAVTGFDMTTWKPWRKGD